ncbi:MAG TPA: hypothetical protein VFY17_05145 [Pilimelia sp.]|nr:hypothetical protein [Pilimelia sp.]
MKITKLSRSAALGALSTGLIAGAALAAPAAAATDALERVRVDVVKVLQDEGDDAEFDSNFDGRTSVCIRNIGTEDGKARVEVEEVDFDKKVKIESGDEKCLHKNFRGETIVVTNEDASALRVSVTARD